MLTTDEFEKIIRGDETPATKRRFYCPRHARRNAYVLGIVARYIYAFCLGKVQAQQSANG